MSPTDTRDDVRASASGLRIEVAQRPSPRGYFILEVEVKAYEEMRRRHVEEAGQAKDEAIASGSAFVGLLSALLLLSSDVAPWKLAVYVGLMSAFGLAALSRTIRWLRTRAPMPTLIETIRNERSGGG